VTRIGKQGQTVGEPSSHEFYDQKNSGDHQRQTQGAYGMISVILMLVIVVVIMAVMVVMKP